MKRLLPLIIIAWLAGVGGAWAQQVFYLSGLQPAHSGGALSGTDTTFWCDKNTGSPPGCGASDPLKQVTLQQIENFVFSGLSGIPPISYGSSMGAIGLNYDSTLSVVGGQLHVNSTSLPAIPNSALIGGNGTTFGNVALGGNLSFTGVFPNQVLNATGGNLTGTPSTVGFVPQYSNNTGTLLNAGLPVGPTGNSTIVETSSGGLISNTLISGLPNTSLASPSVTINTHSLSLGGSLTLAYADLGNIPIANVAGGVGANANTFFAGDNSWKIPATGISGVTTGQVAIGGASNTITSSKPLSNAAATTVATAAGTLTSGHCVSINATGDFVDAGGTCTTGGGGGTVGSGTGPQIAQYPAGTTATVAGVTVSGDVTMAQGGAVTIAALAVTNAKLAAGAASANIGTLTGDLAGSNLPATTITTNAITTGKIANSQVTYGKIQNVSANQLLGNPTGVSAAPVEIPLGANLVFQAGSLVSVPAFPVTTTGGTSGGIPYFSSTTQLSSSGLLAAHGVVIGEGAGAAPVSTAAGTAGQVLTSNGSAADPTFQPAAAGGLSGMTAGQIPVAATATTVTSSKPLSNSAATSIATAAGTLTNGHCVSINGTGDFIDAGGACTVGGGGGTVSSGTAGQVAYYTGTTTVSSSSGLSLSATKLTAASIGLGSDLVGDMYYGATAGALTRLPLGASATFLQSSGGLPAYVALSGDATLAAGGALTIAANAITTGKINNAAVTYAKIQNEGSQTLLGNPTVGAAAPSEITLGTNLSFSGSVLNAASGGITQLTGPVTAGPGSGSQATTIAANAIVTSNVTNSNITYAKIQNETVSTLLGNPSPTTAGPPAEITLGTGLSFSGSVLNGTTGTVTSITLSSPGGIFAVTGTNPINNSGTFGYSTTGTSGGIPYFSSGSALSSSAALTAGQPVIGGGPGTAPSVGTKSGNTNAFVTTTGTQTSGNCVSIDANGNYIANGSPCSTASGTVNSGTTPQAAYYAGTGTAISGYPNVLFPSGFTRFNYMTTPSAIPPTVLGSEIQLAGPDGVPTRFESDAFGASAKFDGVCYGGTGGTLAAVGSGVVCAGYQAFAYAGSGPGVQGPLGGIRMVTTQIQASGAAGMQTAVQSVPNNSTTPTDTLIAGQDGSLTVLNQAGTGTRCIHADSTGKQSASASDCAGGNDTVGTGLTAAGANQSGCLNLTAQQSYVGTVAAGTGVCLPAAAAGGHAYVCDEGTNDLLVYAAASPVTTINNLAATAGITVHPQACAQFIGKSTTAWRTVP